MICDYTAVCYLLKVLWLGLEECSVTWEKASDIPSEVVLEFESGSKAVVTDNTVCRMGQSVHTLTIQQHQSSINPTRPVIKENTGYYDSITLSYSLVIRHTLLICIAGTGQVTVLSPEQTK